MDALNQIKRLEWCRSNWNY